MSEQNNAIANPKMQQFFVTALQEIYWAEIHLQNVLTTMGKAATSTELKQAFDLHAEQTAQHKQRLEQVFNVLNMQPQAEPSIGLQGLFDEGWQVIDETEDGSAVRDVALIVAAQKVEHYEISCYGSLITLAKTNGQDEIAKILAPTLEEEKETDAVLTSIAESGVNEDATQESGNDFSAQATPEQEEVKEFIRQEVTGREDTMNDDAASSQPVARQFDTDQEGSNEGLMQQGEFDPNQTVSAQRALAGEAAMNDNEDQGQSTVMGDEGQTAQGMRAGEDMTGEGDTSPSDMATSADTQATGQTEAKEDKPKGKKGKGKSKAKM